MDELILLVEDEPGLRTTLGDRLRREGYVVETATDGEEGFNRAVSGQFDLIFWTSCCLARAAWKSAAIYESGRSGPPS